MQFLNMWPEFNSTDALIVIFFVALQTAFMQYDRDRSGTVEPHELHGALSAFGKFIGFYFVLFCFVLVFFLFVLFCFVLLFCFVFCFLFCFVLFFFFCFNILLLLLSYFDSFLFFCFCLFVFVVVVVVVVPFWCFRGCCYLLNALFIISFLV